MSKQTDISRRKFVNRTAKVAAAVSLAPAFTTAGLARNNAKKRVVLVGTGSRGTSAWGKNLVGPYADYVEMVGLCDSNYKRVEVGRKIIGTEAKTYRAEEFDKMIKEQKPDIVIVTTTDCYHVDYIVRGLKLGCDVISEKPIATDADQCQRILDTEKETGKKVYVGFNMRFMNESMEMKKVLNSGELGKILSVDFHEYLDTSHGASYFRRWHGKIKYSGSLFVHKSSHHFDLVNWLLGADPVEVQTMGKVAFYGSNNSFRGENCRHCDYKDKCDFYWDILKNKRAKELYVDCEDVDHYYRDGCVWDKAITSYDTGTVQVKYDNGVFLTYMLNAYLPYEGQYISITGEKGRLDVRLYARQPWEVDAPIELRLSKDRKTSRRWTMQPGQGGHGGADERVKDMMFKPGQPDPLGQTAGSRAGVLSSMIGIAARESIESGKPVKISELINLS